jgi:hypothetical protein
MSLGIFLWWVLLCAVSALNVLAWSLSAKALRLRRGILPADVYASRRLQLVLAAGYVFGCAYRAALPVYDVPRICLFDSWLSSVIVGRSVATIAELCFVTQWSLLLWEISRLTGSRIGKYSSRLIVPLIIVAETFSWYSITTTSNFGHVVEETLWGAGAALMAASLVAVWPRCDPARRPMLAFICLITVGYVAFMFLVDVPMYWARWVADEASGRAYMSVTQGAMDASARWVVSHEWSDWKNEIAWMSLYFSGAVWLSIAFVHVPPLKSFMLSSEPNQMKSSIR